MITNDRVEIQAKGVDQITGDNRANFLMNCNGKEDMAVGVDKRRYACFYTPQQDADAIQRDGMGGDYFPNLYAWLKADGYAIVNEYLRTYAIPHELNPATHLHRAPKTSSTEEMISVSIGAVEQEVLEAIGEARPGFANGWISSLALDRLLQQSTRGRSLPHRRRRQMLQSLGYDWHPGLPEGRANNFIPMDNGKPRLFIRRDHIASNIKGGGEIADAYVNAQGPLAAIGVRMRS